MDDYDESGGAGEGRGKVTVKEAAEQLELSVTSVYRLVALGEIKASRRGPKGGKVVIAPPDLEDYKERSEQIISDVQVGELKFIKLG